MKRNLRVSLIGVFCLWISSVCFGAGELKKIGNEIMRAYFWDMPEVPLYVGETPKDFSYIDPYDVDVSADDRRFLAFRFRTPDKITGDFCWMFLLKKTRPGQKYSEMDWTIMEEKEEMCSFQNYWRKYVAMTPNLRDFFPGTNRLIFQHLSLECFKPNTNYMIWFVLKEEDGKELPPLAVMLAMAGSPDEDPSDLLPLEKEFSIQPVAGGDSTR